MENTKQPWQGSSSLPEGWRPLSDAEVFEKVDSAGNIIRTDAQGRVLCRATRRDGEKCKSPVVRGMRVCRMHGGATQKAKQGAKLRLAELVNPAIATLAREMTQADKSVDRQRAANSILDRSGFGRRLAVNPEDVKEQLYAALLEARAKQAAIELGELEAESDDADGDFDDITDFPDDHEEYETEETE